MKTKSYFNLLFLLFLFIGCSLPVFSLTETYDQVLARMERVKELQEKKKKEKACFPAKSLGLTFEHERLPNLNGIWKVTKKNK